MHDAQKIQETVLEKVKFQMQSQVGFQVLDTVNAAHIIDNLSQRVLYNFTMNVFGQSQTHVYTTSIQTPLNWWEHFKLEVLPEWYKRKFPVQYKYNKKDIEFDCKALFPDLDMKIPDQKVVFYSQTNDYTINKSTEK